MTFNEDVLIISPHRLIARKVYSPLSSARRCIIFKDTYPKLNIVVILEPETIKNLTQLMILVTFIGKNDNILAVIGFPSLYHSTFIVGSLTG